MKAIEGERVLCAVYCKRQGNGGEACKCCTLGPATANNFVYNDAVKPLIALEVVADGKDLLEKYVEAYRAELMERLQVEGLRESVKNS